MDTVIATQNMSVIVIGGPLDQHRPDIRLFRLHSPAHNLTPRTDRWGNWLHHAEVFIVHRGVLFLDELPEFGRRVLEVMRQPMEDKIVTISRAQGSLTFLASFQLITAMNPCPCG